MRKLKFLVLTDHRGHCDQNSLYALTRQLAADERTAFVFVASRGDERNAAFFAGELTTSLFGLTAEEHFRFDASGNQFITSDDQLKYGETDVVWLRLPPPADRVLFAHLAAHAPATPPDEMPVIINDPAGILETGSKAFLHHFPGFTAPVRRMQSKLDVQGFAELHPIVLKPLQEYGGRGLVRIMDGKAEVGGAEFSLEEWLETAQQNIEAGYYLGMKYLKNVSRGDKRVLVVNGKIMGASLRLPAPGQWLCNVSQGGTSVPAETTPEEETMIAAVTSVLLEKGIVIFGADMLMDDDGKRVLSELNTNSIGGFLQAEAQTGRPVLQQTINGIYDYLNGRL
jgi:glutathione synthase